MPVQLAASPLRVDQATSICLVATDLTDLEASAHSLRVLRDHEQALAESESRYRELVQNANSAIIRWRADGTITFFNEYAQAFFGYSESEVIGRHVSLLVPHKDSAGTDMTDLAREVTEHPEQYVSHVNENLRRDGRRVWMAWTNRPVYDEHGQVAGILAVGTDITDRKRAEEALQEVNEQLQEQTEELRAQTEELISANAALHDAETRLRLATDATHFGMFDYYPRTGQLIWSNYMREHFGLSAHAQVTYETFRQGLHPDDRERVLQIIHNAMQPESTGEYAAEYRTLGIEDRKERWLESRGQVVFDGQRQPVRFVGGTRDITDRKRAEQGAARPDGDPGATGAAADGGSRRGQQRAGSLHLQRLARSARPLRHVMGFVQLLEKKAEGNLDEPSRRYVRIIREAAQRMGKLIDDLLMLSRVGRAAMAKTEIDLGRLVHEARQELAPDTAGANDRLADRSPAPRVRRRHPVAFRDRQSPVQRHQVHPLPEPRSHQDR